MRRPRDQVLSAFGSVTLDDFDWAVMAEIDRAEIAESIAGARLSVPLLGILFYRRNARSRPFAAGPQKSYLDTKANDMAKAPRRK